MVHTKSQKVQSNDSPVDRKDIHKKSPVSKHQESLEKTRREEKPEASKKAASHRTK